MQETLTKNVKTATPNNAQLRVSTSVTNTYDMSFVFCICMEDWIKVADDDHNAEQAVANNTELNFTNWINLSPE